MKLSDIIHEIEQSAPMACMEPWDNSGWQIRLYADDAEVSRLLVALELSNDVCAEAEALGAQLVLTHHPLFFVPQKSIDFEALNGGYAARLIRAGVSVYAAHTTFDAAPGGMNDCLAALIGLTDVRGFPESAGAPHAIARKGVFAPPRTFGDVCAAVGAALASAAGSRMPPLRVVGDPSRVVRTGAVCGGGGGEYVQAAIDEGIDFYLTSDVKHHEAGWAKERGLCLIDGGHFGTENLFTREMAGRLRRAFGDALDVRETTANLDPWS
jgi:dinuclear metal center YbgI/SA1388 family protein